MNLTIWSGGQSGADIGAWRAAKAAGIPTDGYMTKWFVTEDGNKPEYAELYGAKELIVKGSMASQYRVRAQRNAMDTDATLCFDAANSQATLNARNDCRVFRRTFGLLPIAITNEGLTTHSPTETIAWWIDINNIKSLNVAGNRESKVPGIASFVEKFLGEVFAILKETT